MEDLLKLAGKVSEEAEVYMVSSNETSVGFESNRVKRLTDRQGTSLALRLIKNGKFGYSVTSRLDRPEELLNMAIESSQFGAAAAFHFPPTLTFSDIPLVDKAVEEVTLETMIRTGEDIIARVTANTPGIVIDGRIGKSTVNTRIINSSGADLSFSRSSLGIMMDGNLVRGTDILFVDEMETSCRAVMNSETIIASLIEQLDNSRDIASVSTGYLPVLFTAKAIASALIAPLAQGFNGKMVLQGASPLSQKLGQRVFSKSFNLWDDATTPMMPSSKPFDDEGIISRRTVLVEEGTAAHFYYDMQTGAMAKNESTGNGNRGGALLPAPSINALIIGDGSTPVSEIIRDIREGLVVEMLMGAEQGNTMGGDFSGNVLLGYKIENGRLTGRVKDTMISGNIYQHMKDITLTKESRWVGSMLKSPAILFPRLAVSAKH
ncbi:MAG: TldD/PmbA family protein [Dehalococcoidia bacterium]|nr:TldD/PmbA family protein [Dehalococcoidia bacterium]